MKCQIKTVYTQKTFTAMARALRKSLRKDKSQRIRIFGELVAALGLFGGLAPYFMGISGINWPSLVAAALVTGTMLGEDSLNGWLAGRRMVEGMRETVTAFTTDGYRVETCGAETLWSYDRITCICETDDYYVFLLDKKHGQAYDKRGFLLGSQAELKRLLREKTGLTFQKV